MTCIGIDPSLSKTGACVYDTKSLSSACTEICSTTADGHYGVRSRKIADAVQSFIMANMGDDVAGVFVEYPMNLRGPAENINSLFWHIINAVEDLHIDTYKVSPKELYKFLTGKGQTPAVNKVVAVQKRHGHMIPPEYAVDFDTPGGIEKHCDVYDAIGLSALGECYLGGGDYTKAQREAVSKVKRLGE